MNTSIALHTFRAGRLCALFASALLCDGAFAEPEEKSASAGARTTLIKSEQQLASVGRDAGKIGEGSATTRTERCRTVGPRDTIRRCR